MNLFLILVAIPLLSLAALVNASLSPISNVVTLRHFPTQLSGMEVSAQSGYPPPSSSGGEVAGGAAENMAQVPSPTPAEGYPIPPVATPLPTTDARPDTGVYPGPSPQPAITQPGGAEPATGFSTALPPVQPLITQPPAIGSDTAGTPSAATGEPVQPQSTGTTVFLWLGFLVSLLIFAAGVYGSVLLFTRHRTRGG